ncbi:hypothetical protein [Bifidobacterium adolescentis]|uniref:Uncharacterized protein n=1 Tax=Bifidobacterium adolescentis TaxID=1680 RepID=A0A1X3A1M1_BIFAD|nr:hypothetical protein [Bifidobacterium adolescentis]OSH00588.1 hypothetical protein AL0467_0988 [Bifidobacterium adolescentis]
MDTNEKMAVKIVRDCFTTARETLPAYASCIYVSDMPMITFNTSRAEDFEWTDHGWDFVRRDYVNLV